MDALRAAANAGDARAMSDLGATYAVGGEDVEQSWSEAFRWFTAASEAGSALATMNLAGCYREGNGCAKDEARAVACYRAVAEDAANPEPDAMEVLGEIYSDGACGVERDLAEAARWFTRGAAAGSVECSYRRGVCLATGAGLALDYPAAVAAFTAAANAGHAGAALDLGHCLMNGLGAAPDADLAAKRYRVAADAGLPEAAYHLAMAHVAGRLGARSSERAAVRWLERAAEEGHVEAMGELARVLAGGEGGGNACGNNTPSGRPPKSEATLDRDRARAVEWYRRAAALGHAESAAALGSACFSGVGEVVRADLDEAERWFVRAAELGMEEARGAAADVATERDARAKRAEALDAHDRLWAAFEEKLELRRRGSAAEESEGEGKGPGAKKKNADAAPSASAPPPMMSADEAPVPGAETMDALALAADAPARVAAWRKRWDAFEARHASAFAPGAAAEVERRAEEAFARFPKPNTPKPKRRAPKGDEKAAPAAKAEKEKAAERVPSAKQVPSSAKATPPTPPTLPTPPSPRESNRTASAKAAASRDPTTFATATTTRKQPRRPTARGGSGPDADARRASFAARVKEREEDAVGKEARGPIKPKPAATRPSEGGSGRSKKAVDAAALYPSSPYAAAAPRRRRAF